MPPALTHNIELSFQLLNDQDQIKERRIVLAEDAPIQVGRASKDRSKQLNPEHSNLNLSSSVVSRKHARFTYQPGPVTPFKHCVYLEDMKSTHGTYLNSALIPAGVETVIGSGDEIQFGTTVDRETEVFPPPIFRVRIEEMDGEHPTFDGVDETASLGKSYGLPEEDDLDNESQTGYSQYSDSFDNNIDDDHDLDADAILEELDETTLLGASSLHQPCSVSRPITTHQTRTARTAIGSESSRIAEDYYEELYSVHDPMPTSPVPEHSDDISSAQPSSSLPSSPENQRGGTSSYLATVLTQSPNRSEGSKKCLPDSKMEVAIAPETSFNKSLHRPLEVILQRKRKLQHDDELDANERKTLSARPLKLADQLKEPLEPQVIINETSTGANTVAGAAIGVVVPMKLPEMTERPQKRAKTTRVASSIAWFLAGSVSTVIAMGSLPDRFFQ